MDDFGDAGHQMLQGVGEREHGVDGDRGPLLAIGGENGLGLGDLEPAEARDVSGDVEVGVVGHDQQEVAVQDVDVFGRDVDEGAGAVVGVADSLRQFEAQRGEELTAGIPGV